MTGCSANYCTNSSTKGHRMCKFPKDPMRRNLWKKNVNRLDWTPGPSASICSHHFIPEMWETTSDGKPRLKKTAVPTIFHNRTCEFREAKVEPFDKPQELTDFQEHSVDEITCHCNQPAIKLTVQKQGVNQGRVYYKCANLSGYDCDFYMWEEDTRVMNSNNTVIISSSDPINNEEETVSEDPLSLCECKISYKAASTNTTSILAPLPTNNTETNRPCYNCKVHKVKLESRLSRLEKMFYECFKSKIQTERELISARQRIRRLQKKCKNLLKTKPEILPTH